MSDIRQYEPLWGSWRIESLIGEGSFGKVYKISRVEFGNTYYSAVKIISIPQNEADIRQARSDGLDDESLKSYFYTLVSDIILEINLMNEFRGNSNIVSFEDHKIIEKTGEFGWDILIRMELLTSLSDSAAQKPLNREDVIKLGVHICKALELCAIHNTIHRDVKPDNIFVSKYGEYKLGDFGIARQIERTMSGLSKKGTYSYMAPEVFAGRDYGASVDTYSLGVVMYRFLNQNRIPFLPDFPNPISPRDRDIALQRRMRGDPLPPPKGGDYALNELVLRACAFERAARFASPTQMREALESLSKTPEHNANADVSYKTPFSGARAENKTPSASIEQTAQTDGVFAGQKTGAASEQTEGVFTEQASNNFSKQTSGIYKDTYQQDFNHSDELNSSLNDDIENNPNFLKMSFNAKNDNKKNISISGRGFHLSSKRVTYILLGCLLGIIAFLLIFIIISAYNINKINSQSLLTAQSSNSDDIHTESLMSVYDDADPMVGDVFGDDNRVINEPISTIQAGVDEISIDTDKEPLTTVSRARWAATTATTTKAATTTTTTTTMTTPERIQIDMYGEKVWEDVTYLTLNNSYIEDLTPLKNLTSLTHLDLSNNNINDLTPLIYLQSLTHLDLSGNEIENISPLEFLPNLVSLDLHNNPFEDITPLSGLNNLETLNINNCNVPFLSPAKSLKKLRYLYVINTPIDDWEWVSFEWALPECQVIYEYTDQFYNEERLSYPEENDRIEINIGGMKVWSDVTYLDLSGKKISDLKPLTSFTNLKILNLSNNNISKISVLKDMDKLILIDLNYNPLVDVSPLKNLTHLRSLNISWTLVKDISSLSSLTNLLWLSIGHNEIKDISSIEHMSKLGLLDIQQNNITSIKPLSALSNIDNLIMRNNEISDLSPLFYLTTLRSIFMDNISVSLEQVEELQNHLPNCVINSDY